MKTLFSKTLALLLTSLLVSSAVVFGTSISLAGTTVTTTYLDVGGEWSSANAINEEGQITGIYKNGDGSLNVFLCEDSECFDLNLPCDNSSDLYVWDINNSGEIVGGCVQNDVHRPFLWAQEPSEVFQLLDIPEGAYGSARLINDSGHIAGDYRLSGNEAEVIWLNGVRYEWVTPTEWYNAGTWDMNNLGQTAGGVYDGHDEIAFRAEVVGGVLQPTFFETLGGYDSDAWALNDSGVVVGLNSEWSDAYWRAFRAAEPGEEEALELPAGCDRYSLAAGINNDGYAAGFCRTEDNCHLLLWSPDNEVQDLGVLPYRAEQIPYYCGGRDVEKLWDNLGMALNNWGNLSTDATSGFWIPGSGYIDLCPEPSSCEIYECNENGQCVGGFAEDLSSKYRAVMWTIVSIDSLEELVQEVEELLDEGILDAEQANGLFQKVSQAQIKLDDSSNPVKCDQACYQLEAFVMQVEGLMTGGDLTADQAAEFTELLRLVNLVITEYCSG